MRLIVGMFALAGLVVIGCGDQPGNVSNGYPSNDVTSTDGVVEDASNPAEFDPAESSPADDSDPVAPELTPVPIESGVATLTPENSRIEFIGAHTDQRPDRTGGFERFSGRIEVDPNAKTLKAILMTVETDSLWTQIPRLTNHLKSADFFEVRQFPTATFQSTKIEPTGASGSEYRVTGDLTLHGVTEQIIFPANVSVHDRGLTLASRFTIDRMDFDMNWGPDQVKKDVSLIVLVGEKTQPQKHESGF